MPFRSKLEWVPEEVYVWVTDDVASCREEILRQRPPYRILIIPFDQAAHQVRGLELGGYDFVFVHPYRGQDRLDLEQILRSRIR